MVGQNLTFAFAGIDGLVTVVLALDIRLALEVVGYEESTLVVILNGVRLLGYRPRPTDPLTTPRGRAGRSPVVRID